jgi:hypothetical protein
MSLGKTMVTLLTATWPCVIGVYWWPEFQHPTAFRVTCNNGSRAVQLSPLFRCEEFRGSQGDDDVDSDLGIT